MVKKYKKSARRYRRRRSTRYRKRRNPFSRTLTPNTWPIRLRYVETRRWITPGLASVGIYVFSANGLFDPDITGTGHQPRGFDQIMPLYNHWVVVSSKITVEFISPYEENHNSNSVVGISTRAGTSNLGDINDYVESRNSRYGFLVSTPETPSKKKISKTFSAKKFLGRSHPLSDSQLKGRVNANPTEQAYFHLFAAEMSDSITPDPVRISVHIEYNVVFIEPRTPDQS